MQICKSFYQLLYYIFTIVHIAIFHSIEDMHLVTDYFMIQILSNHVIIINIIPARYVSICPTKE